MSPSKEYSIVPLTTKDMGRMLEFLKRFFFRDEPLNVSVKLVTGDSDRCVELEDYCCSSVHEGLSLMAVSSDGEIVGVCINGTNEPGHQEEIAKKVENCPNPKFRKILRLLGELDRRSNVFGQFPEVDRALEVTILSVDGSWRGRGIATALLDRSRELARENNISLVRVDCTSHFSCKAVARLGFECVFTLPYSEYLDDDGKPVFVPELPHTEARTYIIRV